MRAGYGRLKGLGILLTGMLGFGMATGDTSPVKALIRGDFEAPDFFLELAEVIHSRDAKGFFKFVEYLAENKEVFAETDEKKYEIGKKWITQEMKSEYGNSERGKDFLLGVVDLELGLHSKVPKVVAQYNFYDAVVAKKEGSKACSVFVEWNGKQGCTVEELEKIVEVDTFYGDTYRDNTGNVEVIHSFDHMYEPEKTSSEKDNKDTEETENEEEEEQDEKKEPIKNVGILYGDPRSDGFMQLHKFMKYKADQGDAEYRIRFTKKENGEKGKNMILSGYRVELALKSTEYRVVDDTGLFSSKELREQEGKEDEWIGERVNIGPRAQDRSAELRQADKKPIVKERTGKMEPASMKAAQMVLEAEEPLNMLEWLATDYPKYSHVMMEYKNSSVLEKLNEYRSGANQNVNMITMNGLRLGEVDLEPFKIVEGIERERKAIKRLEEFGLSTEDAVNYISEGREKLGAEGSKELYDTREKEKVVIWLNDLTKDKRYAEWDSGLRSMFGSRSAGELPKLKMNIINVVVGVDIGSVEGLQLVIGTIVNAIKEEYPIRFGIVPLQTAANTEGTEKMVRMFYKVYRKKGIKKVIEYLTNIHKRANKNGKDIEKIAEEEFNKLGIDGEVKNLEKIFTGWKNYVERLELVKEASKSGVEITFCNGEIVSYNKRYINTMLKAYQRAVMDIAKMLLFGKMSFEETDIYSAMLELRGRELVQDKSSLIIADDDEREFKMVQTEKLDEGWMKDIKYITNANSSVVNSNTVTIWMRADLDDVKSKKAVAGVLETMVNKVKKIDIRLGLFLEGTKQIKYTGKGGLIELYYLYKSINNESQTVDAQEIVELAKKTSKVNLKVEDVQAYIEKLSKAQDNQKNKAEELNLVLDKSQTEPGTVLVIGGKIYPTINKKVNVNTKIIRAIIEKEFEDNHEGIEMGDTLKQDNADKFIKCNVVYLETMRQHKSQGLFQNSWKHTRSNIELLIKNPEKFTKITKGKNDYFVEFKAIIDPVSEEAITWAPLLRILSAMTGVKVTVFIEPSADKMQDDGEGTIKKFSRIVMNHKPVFYKGERQEPIGEFENLPRQTLLTLDLKVPSSWMVSASKSEYDLDNIVITDNNDHIAAEYRLNKILLEGHAATTDGVSPAGIQLNLSQLRTKNSTVVSDTAIMANLGYFQLQSEFGAYFLNINKQQTVDDVYRIENIKHDDFNAASSDSNIIVIDSFNGKTIFPVFSKEDSGNLGRRTAQKAVKYLMDYIPRFGGGLTKSKKSLNIFAVASGHLYERLMSIMITSVMKQTQSHVTFWLIDNFMSPKFKNVFLPILSAKLGFEYRLISYKWPYWLNKETVKQRTIWGYKILFLDVLFPMDLERVIFVDADQIVRTDLQQLYDMNINGAPYAYVPFCNDRPEIEGFRFWNHGYWKDHLRGKPYHISALYLVDLTVFRKLLAGDKLRAQYQQLSVDKNSLSNLDQDLPNNMQHLVPIFSLPPEWLWCETWCSSKTFKNAKTIDLCNNPMTKEKKLDVARRLLPEWTQYDNYIHSVLNKAPVKDEL